MPVVPGGPETVGVGAGWNLWSWVKLPGRGGKEAPSSGAQVQKPPRRSASAAYRDCGVIVWFACCFVGFQSLFVRDCWVVERDTKKNIGIERFAC